MARHTSYSASSELPVYKGQHFPTRAALTTYLATELKIIPGTVTSALAQHNWDIEAAVADLKTRPIQEARLFYFQGEGFPSKAAVVRLLIARGMDKTHAGFAVQGLAPGDVTGAVERYCEAFDLDMPNDPEARPKAEPKQTVEPPPRTDLVPYQLRIPEHLYPDILLLVRLLTAQPELHIAVHDPGTGRFMVFTKDK